MDAIAKLKLLYNSNNREEIYLAILLSKHFLKDKRALKVINKFFTKTSKNFITTADFIMTALEAGWGTEIKYIKNVKYLYLQDEEYDFSVLEQLKKLRELHIKPIHMASFIENIELFKNLKSLYFSSSNLKLKYKIKELLPNTKIYT